MNMARLVHRIARAVITLAALAFVTGCHWPATQLLVVVDTDLTYGPGRAIESVAITVRSSGPDGEVRLARRIVVGDGQTAIPLSFGVYPLREEADRQVWIEVRGCGADECAGTSSVATARAQTSFVHYETRVLHLSLSAACAGVACADPTTTCDADDHLCTSARIDPTTLAPLDASAPQRPVHVTHLGAGGGSTCALESDGTVRCWGGLPNTMTQLTFATPASEVPTAVPGLDHGIAVSPGYGHACAVRDDGSVWCWGGNAHGQLGDGTTTDHAGPVQVASLHDVGTVASGLFHTCAVRNDGTVWCWGRQLDPERPAVEARSVDQTMPTQVPNIANVVTIAAGDTHDCALRTDGSVWCWGRNENGQLGDGSIHNRVEPVAVSTATRAIAIVAGAAHTCAVLADRTMQCWGDNAFGQLGSGVAGASNGPVAVRDLSAVVQASSGRHHVCARLADGSARCWGRNDRGQLGDDTTIDRAAPVAVTMVADVGDIAAGAEHTCARRHDDATVSCWGGDTAGQLGAPRTRMRALPTPVPSLNAGALAAGSTHTSALVDVGVVEWGLSIAGGAWLARPALEDGPRTSSASAVSVPGMPAPVRQLAIGYNFACALLADGTVRCWGGNERGELGDGTTEDRLQPTPVVGITNATQLVVGIRHACVLLADGTVRCWGGSLFDEVGFATAARCGNAEACAPTPGQVGGITSARRIAAGGSHTCVVLASGEMDCWGANEAGQLGVPLARSIVHPVPVPAVMNPDQIALGNAFTCAVVDGVVRCFGANDGGQLGSPTLTTMTCGFTPCSVAPIDVPGLGRAHVVELRTGFAHACVRLDDGRIACWGQDSAFQLGVPPTLNTSVTRAVIVPGITNAAQLALGLTHTCVRAIDGSVSCFGDNSEGQLGLPSATGVTNPTVVPSINDAVEVVASQSQTCVRRGSGQIVCFGDDFQGQIGDGLPGNPSTPVTVRGIANAVGIGLSGSTACAVLADTTAQCWGGNDSGQLGDGTTRDRPSPGPVLDGSAPLTGIAQIAGGYRHNCVRMIDGTVRCWGNDSLHSLGDGGNTNSAVPIRVAGITAVRQIVAGGWHTCALRDVDGSVWCWGGNQFGELGEGTIADETGVVQVRGISGATQIAAGEGHTCALLSDGTVWCWGADIRGQLGDGATANHRAFPVRVVGLDHVISIRAGWSESCARTAAGASWCWGAGDSGELGNGDGSDQPAPVQLLVSPIDDIACGNSFTCARRPADHTLVCWGNGLVDQLGQGVSQNSPAPVVVRGVSDVDQIEAGPYSSCALVHDGTVRCWGWNLLGGLGDGTTSTRRTPTAVTGLGVVTDVADGFGFTCARLDDGTARCRGAGAFGQLGDMGIDSRNEAAPVLSLANVAQIDAGVGHACATLTTGTLQCWGLNASGQLGAPPSNPGRGFPLDVPGLTNVRSVATGGRHSCALHTDGTVACWGANDVGQLGRPTTSTCPVGYDVATGGQIHSALDPSCDPTPALVPGIDHAVEIRAGGSHTCARRDDGSVLCWGANAFGQLGAGRTSAFEGPVSVMSLVDCDGLSAGRRVRCDFEASASFPQCVATSDDHTCAHRRDGSVSCWGRNDRGQLGDGTTDDRSSPVPVNGLSATASIVAGGAHSCARLTDGTVQCWGDDSDGQLGDGGFVMRTRPVSVSGL